MRPELSLRQAVALEILRGLVANASVANDDRGIDSMKLVDVAFELADAFLKSPQVGD